MIPADVLKLIKEKEAKFADVRFTDTIGKEQQAPVHLRAFPYDSGSKKGSRMTKPIARDPIYRRRVFDAEIIELCVRWYITYRLSYRDLVGARGHSFPQHNPALGNPVRAGI